MIIQSEALIAFCILGSTCLIILLVYFIRRRCHRINGYTPLIKVKPRDIPPYIPVINPVQPSLRSLSTSMEDLDPNCYGVPIDIIYNDSQDVFEPTSAKSCKTPLRSRSRSWRHQSQNIHTSPNINSQFHRLSTKSYSKSHPTLNSIPSKNNGNSTYVRFSPFNSSEDISASDNEILDRTDSRRFDQATHANCVSMEDFNTPISSPQISRSQNIRANTIKLQRIHKKTPLIRSHTESHPRAVGSPTSSTSSESIVGSPYLNGKFQQFTGELELSDSPPKGKILISLCHNPSEGKLTITIRSVEGLPGVTKSGRVVSECFMKLQVYDSGDKKYKKRASINHDKPNGEKQFDFVVTSSRMPQTSVIIRLYHPRHNILSKNNIIGVVFLGYQFNLVGPHYFKLEKGATHWASIIEKPYLPIEEWHPVQNLNRKLH